MGASESRISGDVSLSKVSLHRSASGDLRFKLPQLQWAPFKAQFGDMTVTAKQVRADGLRTPEGERPRTSIVADSLIANDLRVERGGITVTIERLELADGFRVKDGKVLLCPSATIAGMDFELHLDALAGDGPGFRPASWQFLDALVGHLNVDLFVDLNGPLVGRRTETHKFRIPIASGSIDYEELERDVHWLERSFLDIDVVDGKLVLARDLPLIPFSSKALLRWPLDREELALARKKRVNLRTLMHWELPPEERKRRQRDSSIHLNNLAAQRVDIALGIDRDTVIDFGSSGRVALLKSDVASALSVSGELHYQRQGEPMGTKLSAHLHSLRGSLDSLLLGGAQASAKAFEISSAQPCTLSFQQMHPKRISGRLDHVAARAFRLLLAGAADLSASAT